MSTNKQALRIPEREKHNWGQAVMHTCDFCGQYAMTITREDGEHSCASCLDAEYVTVLTCALEMEIDRAEAAEKRIAELEAREVQLPKPHAYLIWIQAGYAPDDYWDDVSVSHSEKDKCCDGSDRYPVYARWEIEEVLAAAGITVKGE